METLCIDSPCRRGLAVPKAYSCDLRERVIEAVAAGASRREAAERFEVSAASAVKWVQRWRDDNSAAAKPRGGSVSPLEEFATEILAVRRVPLHEPAPRDSNLERGQWFKADYSANR
jgi:transposase-like protein